MDGDAIHRLRDALLKQGAPSIPPPAGERRDDLGPELRAMQRRVRPFVEMMFLVMCADGNVEKAERDALRGAMRSLTGGLLRSDVIDAMIDEARSTLARDGLESRLDAVAAAVYDDHEVAELSLALASAVAQADDALSPEEERVIAGLAERLAL